MPGRLLWRGPAMLSRRTRIASSHARKRTRRGKARQACGNGGSGTKKGHGTDSEAGMYAAVRGAFLHLVGRPFEPRRVVGQHLEQNVGVDRT